MSVMKFCTAQLWSSVTCAAVAPVAAQIVPHTEGLPAFSMLSAECPGDLHHHSQTALAILLDSPETWAPLLRALLSLDIGQTFFHLSYLSCECDKNLSPSGNEVAWSVLTILEVYSEKLYPQGSLSLFQFHWWIHLLQSSQILGGHIANVNLGQLHISSKQKSRWPIFKNPERYAVGKNNNKKPPRKPLLWLIVKIPLILYICISFSYLL